MLVKVFYLNDEPTEVLVRILDSKYDPAMCIGDTRVVLKPAEGRLFEVDIPSESTLFVKKWTGVVMISYTYFPVHVPLDEEPRRWGDQ